MIDSLSIAVHAFVSRVSMSFSVDETLLPRYVNLSTSFRGSVEHTKSILCIWGKTAHFKRFLGITLNFGEAQFLELWESVEYLYHYYSQVHFVPE